MKQKLKLLANAFLMCAAISFTTYSQTGNYVKNPSFDNGLEPWKFLNKTSGVIINQGGDNILSVAPGELGKPRTVYQEIYSSSTVGRSTEEGAEQVFTLYKNRLDVYGYDDFSVQFVVFIKHKDGSASSRYESSRIDVKANKLRTVRANLNINEKLSNIQTVYWGVQLHDVDPANQVLIDDGYFYGNTNQFVKAYGRKLVKGKEEFRLRSIAFTNFYYNDNIQNFLTSNYFTEADFQEVANMGLNCVRFALNGDWFDKFDVSSDSKGLWSWMDQAYAWAKNNNLYIIWEMHQTPGACWLSVQEMLAYPPTSTEWIWRDADKKQLLVDIWKEIATRYKDSTNVAAYGILNEPKTTDKTCIEWYDKDTGLCQVLIDAVREIDDNHLIVIDECEGSIDPDGKDIYRHDDDARTFNDYNLMYDVHYYSPGNFTHKDAGWGGGIDLGVNYPDPIWSDSVGTWKTSNYKAQTYTKTWQTYYSEVDKPTSDVATIEAGVVINDPLGSKCTVYVDNFILEEKKPGETEFKAIRASSVTKGFSDWPNVTKEGFYMASWPHWTWDSADSLAYVQGDYRKVHDMKNAFVIDEKNGQGTDKISLGLTDNYGCVTWGNQKFLVLANTNSEYRVRVDMRVDGTIPSGVDVSPKIEFGQAKAGVDYGQGWVKSTLEKELNEWVTFSTNNNVPISCLEFATNATCYENSPVDHPVWKGAPWGGVQWITDVFDIFETNNMHWCYWAYRNEPMGLYKNTELGQAIDPKSDVDKNIKLYNAVTNIIKSITVK